MERSLWDRLLRRPDWDPNKFNRRLGRALIDNGVPHTSVEGQVIMDSFSPDDPRAKAAIRQATGAMHGLNPDGRATERNR